MANRFWVGNGGNISDTAHWSATSGGVGGASVPTSADNAYFDVNSFTLTGQIVTVDTNFNCLDMDWTGATNTPTLTSNQIINIYGSLTFISAMVATYSGTIIFLSTAVGKTITTNGLSLECTLIFNGVGGGWTLQDNLTTTKTLQLNNGTLNTNGKSVNCATFTATGSNARTLTLGASIITISTNWTFSSVTLLTFNGNSSTLVMAGSGTFAGGGLTYNNVNFTGTSSTITGSNTFNTINQAKGTTLKATSGTTQTVTNPVFNGTTTSPSTLQSVTAGSPATIAIPAGRYFIRHTSIKDITITGATSVTSIAGTDVSGNTGITFVAKFEMGRIKNDGSFNWYNSTTGTVTKVSG